MMKLGTQTGSLINHMMSRAPYAEPEIGMGATILSWSDRTPATIVEILKNGSIIGIQEDNYVRIDKNGMSESQEYEYTPNPESTVLYYKCDKNSKWRRVVKSEAGRFVYNDCGSIVIGHRERYYDFSF